MKNAETVVNVKLNLEEVSFLRSVLFEYYNTLQQEYMCEEEEKSHDSLETKLAIAEDKLSLI